MGFITNLSAQFEARFSMVEVLASPSIIFKGMQGLKMPIVVSHAKGRTKHNHKNDLNQLIQNKQTVMKIRKLLILTIRGQGRRK